MLMDFKACVVSQGQIGYVFRSVFKTVKRDFFKINYLFIYLRKSKIMYSTV